jgi:hypothetical protein
MCHPIQKYFLRDITHHHASCIEYRQAARKDCLKRGNIASPKGDSKSLLAPCLACELDKLMLCYLGSARGVDVLSCVLVTAENATTAWGRAKEQDVIKGEPLAPSEMLASVWKCGGMEHLAGYEQRDAHEFLHGFLDNMGKHDREFQNRITNAISFAQQTMGSAPNGKHSTVGTLPLCSHLYHAMYWRSFLIERLYCFQIL